MKLKAFDKSTSGIFTQQNLGSALTVNAISGRVNFSKGFALKAKVSEGSCVALFQDEERPKDWYIQTNADPSRGFIIHKKSGSIFFTCKHLAREIFTSCEVEDSGNVRLRFTLATEPTDGGDLGPLYAIITKSLRSINRKPSEKKK